MIKKIAALILSTAMLFGTSVIAAEKTVKYDLGAPGYLQSTVMWNGDVLQAIPADNVSESSGSNTYRGCSQCNLKHKSHSINAGIFLQGDAECFNASTKTINIITESNGSYKNTSETITCDAVVQNGPVLVFGSGNAKFIQTDVRCEHGPITDTYYYYTGHPVTVVSLGNDRIQVGYDYNGGVLKVTDTNPTSIKLKAVEDYIPLVMPVKVGYTCSSFRPSNAVFIFCYQGTICVPELNAYTFESAKSMMQAGKVTFTAQWAPANITVNFVNEGCKNASAYDDVKVFSKNASRELSVPEMDGYDFDGFFAGTTKITSLEQIPSDYWNAENKYTVTIKWKKASSDTPAPEEPKPDTIKNGDKITDNKTKASYVVVSTSKKEVTYSNSTNKNATSIKVPSTVVINNVTYKVTKIADNAFKGNKNITNVTIGSNIKTIGKNAFNGCTKLKTVTIGKDVTTIGDNAFYKCTALTKITIPAKVTTIGKNAFAGCKKLTSVTIKATKLEDKTVGTKAFNGISATAKIKVPKKQLTAYKKMLKKKGITGKKQKIII